LLILTDFYIFISF